MLPMHCFLRRQVDKMDKEPSVIKRSHIAAARLRVAIGKREGEPVPDWIVDLAERSMADPAVRDQGQSSEPATTPSSQSQATRPQEHGSLAVPVDFMTRADLN